MQRREGCVQFLGSNAMPIFVVSALLLGFLVKSQSAYLPFLQNQPLWMTSAGLAIACLLAGCFKKLSSSVWHDGFVTGVLWAWYGNWQPLFNHDAPMFYVFPWYYALLSTWLTLSIVNKSARFDVQSRESLAYIQHNLARFDTRVIGVLVLMTLMLPDHYLLYPITMTAFIVRHTLQRCLEIVENS